MTRRSPLLTLMTIFLPLLGALCVTAGMIWAIAMVQFTIPALALIVLGVLLFLSIFLQAERANLRYYLHVTIYSLIVGGVCVVAYLFANRYPVRVDLTRQQLYSLSEPTRAYLETLDKPVTITLFMPESEGFTRIRNLYDASTDKIEWTFADPIKNPVLAENLGQSIRPGDIVVASGENKKKLSVAELPPEFQFMPLVAENTFTNAIVEVTRAAKPKVYYTTGHGEADFTRLPPPAGSGNEKPESPPSIEALRKALSDRGIEAGELDLIKTGQIPVDATVVVIAGPKQDFFKPEADALRAYLDQGGHLLALLDPGVNRQGTVELPNLEAVLAAYGVNLPNAVVFDAFGLQLGYNPPLYPLMSSFDTQNPITSKLVGSGRSFIMSPTRPIEEGDVPKDMTFTALVKSSPDSWTEEIANLKGTIDAPPENQRKPAILGVAVTKTPPPALPGMATPKPLENNPRIVVFGSSLLVQDRFLTIRGNDTAILLMFNTFDWLTGSAALNIPARLPEGTPIVLDEGQMRLIFIFSVILLPAVLFFGGVSYSVMRRRR